MSDQWQGSLAADKPSRILLLVDQASTNPTRAVVYLLDGDNPSWPHATSSFSLQGHDVTFRIANLDISFKGQLAADGAYSGVWQQQGTATSVTLGACIRRRCVGGSKSERQEHGDECRPSL